MIKLIIRNALLLTLSIAAICCMSLTLLKWRFIHSKRVYISTGFSCLSFADKGMDSFAPFCGALMLFCLCSILASFVFPILDLIKPTKSIKSTVLVTILVGAAAITYLVTGIVSVSVATSNLDNFTPTTSAYFFPIIVVALLIPVYVLSFIIKHEAKQQTKQNN